DWQMLTRLPIANGLAYLICQYIVRRMQIGYKHDDNTGCLNDYLWDKTGIDVCIRAAFLCERCKERSEDNAHLGSKEFADISSILNAISAASRSGVDILRETTSESRPKAVFLCHNSADKLAVRRLNAILKTAGINTWFDEDKIEPGHVWQETLQAAI